MAKVKIAESIQDNLKVATGFAKVVDNYGFGTSKNQGYRLEVF